MKKSYFFFVWTSGLAVLFANVPFSQAQDDVRITEFMASNSRTLQDEDHTFPDWIEIFNASTNTVNLFDWSLTDSVGNLTKWRFPATNLASQAFLVVFADSKNRVVPGAPLHTSFNLSASGEYLALVRPDGTIATEFRQINNGFPPQAPDVSYGFAPLSTTNAIITTNSSVRWHIPDGTEGDWTGTNYNDSGWALGTNGLGFGSFVSANYGQAVLPTAPLVYYRLNESSGLTAANLGSAAASDGSYNSIVLGTAGPRPASSFNGFESDNNAPTFNGTSSYVGGPSQLLSGSSAFTIAGWVNFGAAPAARTGLFGQNDTVEFGFSAVGSIQCFTAGGGSTTIAYNPPLNTWVHILAVGDGSTVRIFVNGALLGSGGTATANYGSSAFNFNIGGGGVFDATGNFFTGQMDEVVAYRRALSTTEILGLYQAGTTAAGFSSVSLISTDVAAAMSNVNASAYVRIPFVVTNAANIALVTLRMRYNDGFVASINGSEAVRVNASDPISFTSAATNAHLSLAAEEFRLGTSTLVTGTNILAIQGLNVAANDTNFFISAELALSAVEADSPTPVFFTVPTPGAPNIGGIANPGPAILNASNYPVVPRDYQDMTVTAKIVPTFYAVSNVVMRYRIMFGNTNEVQMFDDGLHGDGAAGDGVFGATIPENASTNGQMIRWYFLATDIHGNTSRWPLFADPGNSAEYLGTIVDPTNLTSKLPIYHLFAPTTVLNPGPTTTQTGADSQTGGRVSIFYDGEFYDNVLVNLRGNTTAGFNKKSHHVNFNHEHPFRHTGPGGRILHTSFMADYIDPTYMRQGLSFWLAGQIGAPEPFYYPVRLQLNGQFYMLANHDDVVGAEQIGWFGYDPNGALYKAAGVAAPSQFSTGNFEKKTRLNEPNTDYLTLTSGINETNNPAARRTNVFDMLDLPEVISYMVTARWAHENDDTWANMTLYRDTDGDGLWRIIPFDMNLSWGAIYYEGSTPLVIEGVQATNDIHKAFPMFGSTNALPLSGPGSPNNFNRMYDVIFSVPETRQMFLRRMRSLLDAYIKPIGTPTNTTVTEQKILAWRDLISDEARQDRLWWGWAAKGGQNNFDPPPNAGAFGSVDRTNASTVALSNGVYNLLYAPTNFFLLRRAHFYGKHSITNTALPIGISKDQNAGIPLPQPPGATISLVAAEPNPSSGDQTQEYFCLTNPAPVALDISGWTVSGAVDFTFKPGTVMPSNSLIFLSPNVAAFRTRASSPHAGQGLFVVGPYNGQLSARGEPIIITDNLGRVVGTNTYPGNPTLAQSYLRITEIMYHPSRDAGALAGSEEEYEYLELKNISTNVTLNLNGVHFTNGIEFSFTGSAVTNLDPGQTVLIVKNLAAFTARYGSGFTIAGQYVNFLDNAGEELRLDDAVGEKVLEFTYNNSWYPITDGAGPSLVVVDENALWSNWDQKGNWRPSGYDNGSPGTNDPPFVSVSPILVNEVLSHSDPPLVDVIELYNPGSNAVNLAGWYLTDDFVTPKKYRITNNVVVPPGGYVTFNETNDFNATNGNLVRFAFSSQGDEAYVFSGDGSGHLTGYFHGFNFGASESGVSFGRYLNSVGDEHFVAQNDRTFGTANAGPRVGPLVINQLMYHPPDFPGGVDDQVDEFIELHNLTTNQVPLFDPLFPTNTWHLRNAVDFAFPTNIFISPTNFLLLVSFNPADASLLASFRSLYAVPPDVPIFGPYTGKLNNSGDSVELAKPDAPLAGQIPYVLVDKVSYQNSGPWPPMADGLGASLHRVSATGYGNDPTNWIAAGTSIRVIYSGGLPPVITTQPTDQVMLLGGNVSLHVSANGSAPLSFKWRFNGDFISNATTATLTLTNVQPSHSGLYQVIVLNSAGAVTGSNATLTVVPPISIIQQPESQTNRLSSLTDPVTANVTLSALASSAIPISYQWRLNGANLPGATGAVLILTNVTPSQAGDYTVVASDAFGSVTSAVARLTIFSNSGWRFASITANMGATAAAVGTNVLIYMQAAGDAYVDDVSLVPLTGQYAGSNILQNSSFESPLGTLGTNWFAVGNVTNSVITNTYAHSGNYSLHVVATGGGSPSSAIKQFLPLLSINTTSTLSFWYHTVQTNPITAGQVTNVVVRTFPGSSMTTNSFSQPTDLTPTIASQPNSLSLGIAAVASFGVTAFGSEPLAYQWFKDGVALSDGGKVAGSATASLTVSAISAVEIGNYSVKVSNALGFTNSALATLNVTGAPPQITLQPQSQSVPCNGSVTFSAGAIGSLPLAYQWLSNQIAILNATNSSVTLTNLALSASGAYSVAVSNPVGSTNSVAANLVVTDPVANLSFQRNGTNLVVSWPASCTTYQLQEAPILDPAAWATSTVQAQQVGALWTATIPITNTNKFYRLHN